MFTTVVPVEEVKPIIIQKKPPTVVDVDIILGKLNRYGNRILFSDNDKWYEDTSIKEILYGSLDKLMENSNELIQGLGEIAKTFIDLAYKYKEKYFIKDLLQYINNKDQNNMFST